MREQGNRFNNLGHKQSKQDNYKCASFTGDDGEGGRIGEVVFFIILCEGELLSS